MERPDPFTLFDEWFAEAQASEPNDPNAMALATSGGDGQPSVRMVLLKGHGPDLGTHGGFTFYTNFESRKAMQLSDNLNVALLFHWKSLRRQIRIEGQANPVDDATADAYFATRSRNSQLGAWASNQSRPLTDRETFEARLGEFGVRVRSLTRMTHTGEVKNILKAMKDGTVDVIIGTHRLLSEDIRFRRL